MTHWENQLKSAREQPWGLQWNIPVSINCHGLQSNEDCQIMQEISEMKVGEEGST